MGNLAADTPEPEPESGPASRLRQPKHPARSGAYKKVCQSLVKIGMKSRRIDSKVIAFQKWPILSDYFFQGNFEVKDFGDLLHNTFITFCIFCETSNI